jgi:hypothetical protein
MIHSFRLLTFGLLAAGLPMNAQQANSPDEFLRQVVTAFAAKDQQTLQQVTITETEFKQCVWPSIAAQVSGNHTNASNYYQTFAASSKIGMADHLKELTESNYTLVRSSFGPEKRQKGCRLLPAPTVMVRASGGEEKTVRIGAGVIEQGGKFKITSYYVAPRSGK